jgi:ATP-dependent Clp protease ATP-binding subunit ClpC
MFEYFSPDANRVLHVARHQAWQLRAPAIGAEHILLGLLACSDKKCRRFLMDHGINSESVRNLSSPPLPELPRISLDLVFTEETKRILGRACEIADRYSQHNVAPKHLLLAILYEKASSAAMLLTSSGINPATVMHGLFGHLS